MKRIVIAAFAAVIGLGMMIPEAEARRLGGGKSIGMSRNTTTDKPAAPPPKQATAQQAAPAAGAAAAAPAAASGMSRWMGPIAGLAAGLGLAALFSHLGMGEGLANFVMIALLAMAAIFVLRLIFRKKQPAAAPMQYAGAGAPANFDAARDVARFDAAKVGAGSTATAQATTAGSAIPADFDVEGFVRQAKLNFVRLQAANDRGDMDDIREFTAPELFAEIQMQYQERGKSAQQTDVMELNADLLEVVTEDKRHVASVRFFGQLREDSSAAAEAFDEIWHLTKPVDGSRGWRIDGIQQA